MIVVMVIIGILLTMMAPQFSGNQRRQFKLLVDQVADLLAMYAQRETLGQKVVGISLENGSLVLLTLDTPSMQSGSLGQWVRDLYVKPVRFPDFMLGTDIDVQADGERVDIAREPLSNELGKDRPTIQISLRGPGENAVITLYPYSIAPEIISGTVDTTTNRDRVDLDGMGRSREDW